MNSASFRRLAKDHAALHNAELPPYYLFAPNSASGGMPDDLTQLTVHLTGPQGTPYANGVWKLHLKIPQDYPKNPPKAYFKTKIWHPNVEESNGNVCLDTLKRDWQSKLTLRDILITISCLLINPNPDSALNAAAGKLLQEDWDQFSQHAKLMTSIHASIPSNLREAVREAKRRGEDNTTEDAPEQQDPLPQQPQAAPQPQPELSHQNPDSDSEEENSKENDSSLSPSPTEPTHPTIRRPTILGKRPLGELPTPEEPPSDDEDAYSSARNIAANAPVAPTPNLSSHLTNLSFDSDPTPPAFSAANASLNPARREAKLTERVRGTNFSSSFSAVLASAETGGRAASCGELELQGSRAKRVRSDEGKENEQEDSLARALGRTLPKPAPLVGLGVRTGVVSAPASRKGSAMGGAGAGRGRGRVGMRRL